MQIRPSKALTISDDFNLLDSLETLNVLIADDDEDLCRLFRFKFKQEGINLEMVHSRKSILDEVGRNRYHAILIDICLGEDNGLDAIPSILQKSPQTKLWVLTANGSIERAVKAMRLGASGFFTKNEDTGKIARELRAALHCSLPLKFYSSHKSANGEKLGIIGKSQALLKVVESIERMKDVDSTVLISGESGTGKELIARGIHQTSPRKEGNFIAINCAAIPENLLESELFGHRKGAFTDAKTDRKGIFELCSDGTLFLDEIGDMPHSLQVKLLRVLQDKEIRPVGSAQTIKVNTRVLAATNKNLEKEVREGRFREDLFYRLTVLRIYSPPLRERNEDISVLVEHFLHVYNTKFGKNIASPNQEVYSRLSAYQWPGNIRELQNAIERAVVLSTNQQLEIDNLFFNPAALQPASPRADEPGRIAEHINPSVPFHKAKEEFEVAFFRKLIEMTNGNISEMSRVSGEHRSRIYRLLKKYSLLPINSVMKEQVAQS